MAEAPSGRDGPHGSFYCSTSGTMFEDMESLTQHYKSDFHRYNLKRKVAGLPPVTREWFDARKSQLAHATSTQSEQKVWIDPLTKKKFSSENTYIAHTQSKKFKDLLKKSGQPAPPPVIVSRKQSEGPSQPGAEAPAATSSSSAKPVAGVWAAAQSAHPQAHVSPAFKSPSIPGKGQDMTAVRDPAPESDESESEADGSEWETDEEGEEDDDWQQWDVCMSLFDSHVSPSMEANLEYMQRKFGFSLPDPEHLKDREGLLRYLGAKLHYGKVPLYARGDDQMVKTFRSLHAVQRHMVDTNQCKMVYEDNEEEYADYYSYSDEEEDDDAGLGQQLIEGGSSTVSVTPGYELALQDTSGKGGKIVGSRDLHRYYRQRHRPEDTRTSVVVNTFLAKYRALALTAHDSKAAVKSEDKTAQQNMGKRQLNLYMKANVLHNLPNNVPY